MLLWGFHLRCCRQQKLFCIGAFLCERWERSLLLIDDCHIRRDVFRYLMLCRQWEERDRVYIRVCVCLRMWQKQQALSIETFFGKIVLMIRGPLPCRIHSSPTKCTFASPHLPFVLFCFLGRILVQLKCQMALAYFISCSLLIELHVAPTIAENSLLGWNIKNLSVWF